MSWSRLLFAGHPVEAAGRDAVQRAVPGRPHVRGQGAPPEAAALLCVGHHPGASLPPVQSTTRTPEAAKMWSQAWHHCMPDSMHPVIIVVQGACH